MNLTTGKFTAPRPAIYFFSFSGVANFQASSSLSLLSVVLYLNGGPIGTGWAEEENNMAGQYSPLSSIVSTLNLKKGDQVWVEIHYQSTKAYLKDDVEHFTHFTGFLLDEEIVASL